MSSTDWFQIGKGVRQGCTLSSCLFKLYAEYIMQNSGLEEAAKYISHDYIYSAWDWRYQPKKKNMSLVEFELNIHIKF